VAGEEAVDLDGCAVLAAGRLNQGREAAQATTLTTAGHAVAVADAPTDSGDDRQLAPLAGDPAWADVTPIPQDDGPSPVAAIAYTDECTHQRRRLVSDAPARPDGHVRRPLTASLPSPTTDREAMDYMRAVLAAREQSLRALALTERVLRMNPAHYPIW